MQVWNVLQVHTACLKYRMQKNRHLSTIAQLCWAVSLQLRHISTIAKNTCSAAISRIHVLVIWWTLATNGRDRFRSLGHPCKSERVSRLGSVTSWHSSSGRQPYFVALNRGRHLYSAGQPSHLVQTQCDGPHSRFYILCNGCWYFPLIAHLCTGPLSLACWLLSFH